MSNDFNPAQRLHDLLAAGPAEKTDQIEAISVFSEILNVHESNGSVLLARIASMLALPDEIKSRVEAIDGISHALYLSWYDRAKSGVCELNLRGNWRNFISYFPAASLTSIQFCSDLISNNFPERAVEKEGLDSLVTRIDEIIDELGDFDISSADYFFVLHHLKTLRDSLLSYNVTGLSGIEDAYEQTIGALATHPEVQTRLSGQHIWNRILKVVLVTGWIVSTYGGASQLTQDVARLMNVNESAYEDNMITEEFDGLMAISSSTSDDSDTGGKS